MGKLHIPAYLFDFFSLFTVKQMGKRMKIYRTAFKFIPIFANTYVHVFAHVSYVAILCNLGCI